MQQTFSAKKKKLWAQNNFITPPQVGNRFFSFPAWNAEAEKWMEVMAL